MITQIPTEQQYLAREARVFREQLDGVERAPLKDRRLAGNEFAADIRDRADLVIERVGWVLAGHYGRGPYEVARAIANNPRCNRHAQLVQIAAALDWGCPVREARKAWRALSIEQKLTLSRGLDKVLSTTTER